MESSFSEQFTGIVLRAKKSARAYLCDGDTDSAVVWDPDSEITIRLSLREDEVWLIAGSGSMFRFVAATDSEFDHGGIDFFISSILRSEMGEHFGAVGKAQYDSVVTGHAIVVADDWSGGLASTESKYQARIAVPMASARMRID
jgi:hypothetical protein